MKWGGPFICHGTGFAGVCLLGGGDLVSDAVLGGALRTDLGNRGREDD